MTIEPKTTDMLIYSKLSTLTELYKYQIERFDELQNAVLDLSRTLNDFITISKGDDS